MDFIISLFYQNGHYRLVAFSAALSALALGQLLFYRLIWPKKNPPAVVILLTLAVLPLFSLLRPGPYESGDMALHATRAIAFFAALQDGQIIPRWAGELNAGYGYPLFQFIYPLPYYVIAFFHLFGFGFITSVKLSLASAFVLSGLAMHYWAREHLPAKAALITALFYLFSPYHLVDLHFRVAIGELWAFVFLPLAFWGLAKRSAASLGLTAVSLAGLILSHQAISLASLPLLIGYAGLVNRPVNSLKKLRRLAWPFVLGLALAAFYWLPAVLEAGATHQAFFAQGVEFVGLPQLLYSPWRWGLLFQGRYGELALLIGYAQWLAVFWTGYLLLAGKLKGKNRFWAKFWLAGFSSYLLLMLPISQPVWDSLPLVKNFHYTYRLLAIISLPTAMVAGLASVRYPTRRKLFYPPAILVSLAVFSTILNWGNRGTLPQITDQTLRKNLPFSTAEGEGLDAAASRWVDPAQPWTAELPTAPLEIVEGHAQVVPGLRTSTKHEYTVTAKKETTFKENTWYFPGWELRVAGKSHPFTYQDPRFPGLITFSLTAGEHQVELLFRNTPLRWLALLVSLAAVLILIRLAVL